MLIFTSYRYVYKMIFNDKDSRNDKDPSVTSPHEIISYKLSKNFSYYVTFLKRTSVEFLPVLLGANLLSKLSGSFDFS